MTKVDDSPHERIERIEREREHAESLLDDALRATFPASDPIAVFVPAAPDRAAR